MRRVFSTVRRLHSIYDNECCGHGNVSFIERYADTDGHYHSSGRAQHSAGIFPGIGRAPFSEIASSRRRSGYPACTNSTVRRFNDCALPPKEWADMAMAVGLLWVRQDL